MTSGPAPMCIAGPLGPCIHLHDDSEDIETEDGLHRTCDAFPQGIPDDIYFEATAHDIPHADDSGIRYEGSRASDG